VRLEASDSQACLVVQDTGEGISADFLPHVFEQAADLGVAATMPKPVEFDRLLSIVGRYC
jgi:hypothetical protein